MQSSTGMDHFRLLQHLWLNASTWQQGDNEESQLYSSASLTHQHQQQDDDKESQLYSSESSSHQCQQQNDNEESQLFSSEASSQRNKQRCDDKESQLGNFYEACSSYNEPSVPRNQSSTSVSTLSGHNLNQSQAIGSPPPVINFHVSIPNDISSLNSMDILSVGLCYVGEYSRYDAHERSRG